MCASSNDSAAMLVMGPVSSELKKKTNKKKQCVATVACNMFEQLDKILSNGNIDNSICYKAKVK